jgi:hypothetical protein
MTIMDLQFIDRSDEMNALNNRTASSRTCRTVAEQWLNSARRDPNRARKTLLNLKGAGNNLRPRRAPKRGRGLTVAARLGAGINVVAFIHHRARLVLYYIVGSYRFSLFKI